jgi:hypothetical protein
MHPRRCRENDLIDTEYHEPNINPLSSHGFSCAVSCRAANFLEGCDTSEFVTLTIRGECFERGVAASIPP